MPNSSYQETTMIFTTKENFNNFPLIVSHSNYKRTCITSEELIDDVLVETKMIGFEFEKQEDAIKYQTLLDQLSIKYTSCGFIKISDPTDKVVVTAALVKELRDKSGLSMMECKKALTEANGDINKALELIQSYGRNTRFTTCRR